MKERILVFNVNWIGDVLFSTAVIRNLRDNFPDSHIACIIPPRCLPVLEGNPYLDEIIVFDEKGRHKGLGGMLSFCLEIRKRRFDRVYLLHRSFSRGLITFLAGIPERVGFHTRKRAFLLTRNYPAPDIFKTHRVDCYLDLLRQSGLEVRERHTDFRFSQADRDKVSGAIAGFRREGELLVGLNPGGNWLPKRWPAENFIALAGRLVSELPARVIVTGGPSDRELADRIVGAAGGKGLSVCGEFNLKEFGALSGLLDVFITADSGPLHIAAASGARHIIALFGPTDPALTGPVQDKVCAVLRKDAGCRIPCYVADCPDNRCMKAITVDEVFEEIKKFVVRSS